MRYFNTAGPCVPELNYMVPAEQRLPEARKLVRRGMYFVVHAPRQTGKTTTLRSLARTLTAEGDVVAIHFSCETGEVAGDNYLAAQRAILNRIRTGAEIAQLPSDLMPPDPWPDAPDENLLGASLRAWSERCPRPLVLFFDEIDALRGESLRSVLRQLRDGYSLRPASFPASIVLCGLRDVRDYKAAAGGDPTRLGTASPFNIKVASLRLGDFDIDEVRELYGQHTTETGQEFAPGALERAFEHSQGQPWLTNALAYEIVDLMEVEPSTPITADHVDEARERIIRKRETHLDSLVDKLNEPRVARVIEPLIAGEIPETSTSFDTDLAYVQDLGLIAPDDPVRVANPIYKEVILRVLGTRAHSVVTDDPRAFVLPDGRLDFDMLLREFTAFWVRHGDILASGGLYHEVAPQLVILAYMQRIVNGGGRIEREYSVGRGRIDVRIDWPYDSPTGKRLRQEEAAELKVWADGRPDPLDEGLAQLDVYLDGLQLDHGTLVIFDRRPDAQPIDKRTTLIDTETPSGRKVTLLRA